MKKSTLLASAAIRYELDSAAIPVPFMQPGVTDARFFAQLGMQTYGFVPLRLPTDFDFVEDFGAYRACVRMSELACRRVFQRAGAQHFRVSYNALSLGLARSFR